MGTILHLDWCWDLTRCDFSLTSGMRNYCFLKRSKVEHVNPFKCRTIDAMSLALEVDHSSPGLMLDPTWCDFSLTSGMRNYCFLKRSEVEPVNPFKCRTIDAMSLALAVPETVHTNNHWYAYIHIQCKSDHASMMEIILLLGLYFLVNDLFWGRSFNVEYCLRLHPSRGIGWIESQNHGTYLHWLKPHTI